MYTYRKQVSPNSTTPASTTNYVVYSLDLNSIATYNMADVEVIASLYSTENVSTIYYRKLQLVNPALTPIYAYPPKNSSFDYVLDVGSDLYLSKIICNSFFVGTFFKYSIISISYPSDCNNCKAFRLFPQRVLCNI